MVWPSWYDDIRNEKAGARNMAPAFLFFFFRHNHQFVAVGIGESLAE